MGGKCSALDVCCRNSERSPARLNVAKGTGRVNIQLFTPEVRKSNYLNSFDKIVLLHLEWCNCTMKAPLEHERTHIHHYDDAVAAA